MGGLTSMVHIAIASDNIHGRSKDTATLNTVANVLKGAGHEVTVYGVGSNLVQSKMLHDSADVMIQVAGGVCLGTLVDFMSGIRRGYYHAKKGGFMYYDITRFDVPSWKAHRAWDDNFSSESSLKPYKGKTLDSIYQENKDIMTYSHGTDATKMAQDWLTKFGGGSTGGNADEGGGGSSVFDAIKEVCNDWNDDPGIEMTLNNNTLSINRCSSKDNVALTQNTINNDSVTINEYDDSTPNKIELEGTKLVLKDDVLLNKYEENKITCKTEKGTDNNLRIRDMYHLNRRGHNHSIDLKVLMNTAYNVGEWVKLELPLFNIDDYYYITKTTYDGDLFMSLSLEPFAPDRHYEKEETTTEGTGTGNANLGKICTAIQKVGGVTIKDPRSLYENFKKMKYKGYNNDLYSLDTELSMIQKGEPLNCIDFAQLYYNAFKEAGFSQEIRYVLCYIRCSRGSFGHGFCQVKENGNWVDVDPSGAAKLNRAWGQTICSGNHYTVRAYNIAWMMSDDGKT